MFLLFIPVANAWKADTHKNIIEYIYLNLPSESQNKLNLTKLKDGSVIPDRDFKDHKRHSYPNSLYEAKKWLENNDDLSLSLGIASHYITDSFAAPHNVRGEDYYLHAAFEGQVKNYYPNIKCGDYGFSLEDLNKVTKNSRDWHLWLNSKNKKIPQKEVDESTKFLFSIILKKLNTTCSNFSTEFSEVPYFSKNKIILIFFILLIGYISLKLN